ncbi:MAG: ABC transporter ATP-binding protein [Succinivibrio sp.]
MTAVLLQAKNIKKDFIEGKVKTEVLKGVNIDIYSSMMTAITGKSGSGKSTLLHILGTLDSPSSGQLLFKGEDLTRYSDNKKAVFRSQSLGFVYQFHHLLNDFSALENVMMPLLIAGTKTSMAEQTAKEYLEKVGLKDRLNYRPSELSGGQRQRVAIARALVNRPKLILADEPTGNLDAQNAGEIFDLFTSLVKNENIAVAMVTHDPSLAERCDITYSMTDGVIVSDKDN